MALITIGILAASPSSSYVARGSYQGGTQSAVSDDNKYVIWFSNKTGDWEALFGASNDGGDTFADKINLSNSTGSDSVDVELAAAGEKEVASWWETTDEPVTRISIDNGVTFGPLLRLGNNGRHLFF